MQCSFMQKHLFFATWICNRYNTHWCKSLKARRPQSPSRAALSPVIIRRSLINNQYKPLTNIHTPPHLQLCQQALFLRCTVLHTHFTHLLWVHGSSVLGFTLHVLALLLLLLVDFLASMDLRGASKTAAGTRMFCCAWHTDVGGALILLCMAHGCWWRTCFAVRGTRMLMAHLWRTYFAVRGTRMLAAHLFCCAWHTDVGGALVHCAWHTDVGGALVHCAWHTDVGGALVAHGCFAVHGTRMLVAHLFCCTWHTDVGGTLVSLYVAHGCWWNTCFTVRGTRMLVAHLWHTDVLLCMAHGCWWRTCGTRMFCCAWHTDVGGALVLLCVAHGCWWRTCFTVRGTRMFCCAWHTDVGGTLVLLCVAHGCWWRTCFAVRGTRMLVAHLFCCAWHTDVGGALVSLCVAHGCWWRTCGTRMFCCAWHTDVGGTLVLLCVAHGCWRQPFFYNARQKKNSGTLLESLGGIRKTAVAISFPCPATKKSSNGLLLNLQ